MIDGIYAIRFQSNLGMKDAGIVVLDAGKVHGGDCSHFYKGTYELDNMAITACLSVEQYDCSAISAFGYVQRFDLNFEGTISGDNLVATGNVDSAPDLILHLSGKRLSDLAT